MLKSYIVMKKRDDIELVSDNFSIWCLLFTAFWLLYNKLYDVFLLWLVLALLFINFPCAKALIFGLNFLITIFSSELKSWTLQIIGYNIEAIVMASCKNNAIKRYYDIVT